MYRLVNLKFSKPGDFEFLLKNRDLAKNREKQNKVIRCEKSVTVFTKQKVICSCASHYKLLNVTLYLKESAYFFFDGVGFLLSSDET